MPATENDFDKDHLTPTYEYYDDDHQDATPDAPPEQLTPTPEIGDNNLNMELMLPRGGTLARGRVIEELALLPRYPVLTLTTRPLKPKCMACLLTSVT